MKQHRKAQSTTELLVIFGVAIILALIVAVAFFNVPLGFDSSQSREDRLYFRNLPVGILSGLENGTGVDFVLQNNLLENVTVLALYVEETNIGISSVTLRPGEQELVTSSSYTYDSGRYFLTITYALDDSAKTQNLTLTRGFLFS